MELAAWSWLWCLRDPEHLLNERLKVLCEGIVCVEVRPTAELEAALNCTCRSARIALFRLTFDVAGSDRSEA